MHLSHVSITNFRNFSQADVSLERNTLIVGENRVGKSNFLYALRLVLDANLPDTARILKLSDLWDGVDFASHPSIKISLQFVDFESNSAIDSLLCDHILPSDPTIAQITYLWRPKTGTDVVISSFGDYEFLIYGGDEETKAVSSELRRRVCFDVMPALRDAEQELGSWRSSPLRPSLERAIDEIPGGELKKAAESITQATTALTKFDSIQRVESDLRESIQQIATNRQDLKPKLGFVASDPGRVFRSLTLYIDEGKRAITDASLGSANLALIAMRIREFEWKLLKNERNFSFICIEEPEAHLHPHLQRSLFSHLLRKSRGEMSIVLTTHSPQVASVAPLKSIVVLREILNNQTKAYSSAHLDITAKDQEDIERYLDATRAELLFARGVIFVEGDAEATLMPAFAEAIGLNLDELGITTCNVSGTHFEPYVNFAIALGLPYVVITDWDPPKIDKATGKPIVVAKTGKPKPPLGIERSIQLIGADYRHQVAEEIPEKYVKRMRKDTSFLRKCAMGAHVFLNESTLEVELMHGGLRLDLITILQTMPWGKIRKSRLKRWKKPEAKVDSKDLLNMISDVGKGRFAGRVLALQKTLNPPDYIFRALKSLERRV